jgi:hypothetical protein
MRQQIRAYRVPSVAGPRLDGAKILKGQRMLEREPSLVRWIYGEPSIACSVPVSAVLGVKPSFGEEKVLLDQISRMFRVFR